MPGTQKPVGAASSTWQWVQQVLTNLLKRVSALESQQTMIILDQYGNATAIIGQLNQTVTEGASFGVSGTQSSTGLTGTGLASFKTGSWVQL